MGSEMTKNEDIFEELMTCDDLVKELLPKERYAIRGCQDEFDKDVWHYALTFKGIIISDIRVEGTMTPEEALPLLIKTSIDWDWDRDCTYPPCVEDVKYEITDLQIKEVMAKYKLDQIQEDF